MGIQSFQEFGLKGLTLAAVEIAAVMALTLWLSRVCHIGGSPPYPLAGGMAICGVTAVIALACALESEEEDTCYAVSVVLLFRLLTLSSLPALGHLLHMSDFHFGVWAGLAVNNTAEAVATGFIFSDLAGHYSTIAKLSRNAFLGFAIIYLLGIKRRGVALGALEKVRQVARGFPKFAIGLLLFSGLATLRF